MTTRLYDNTTPAPGPPSPPPELPKPPPPAPPPQTLLRGSWDLASRVTSTLIEVISRYNYSYLTYNLTLLTKSPDPLSMRPICQVEPGSANGQSSETSHPRTKQCCLQRDTQEFQNPFGRVLQTATSKAIFHTQLLTV